MTHPLYPRTRHPTIRNPRNGYIPFLPTILTSQVVQNLYRWSDPGIPFRAWLFVFILPAWQLGNLLLSFAAVRIVPVQGIFSWFLCYSTLDGPLHLDILGQRYIEDVIPFAPCTIYLTFISSATYLSTLTLLDIHLPSRTILAIKHAAQPTSLRYILSDDARPPGRQHQPSLSPLPFLSCFRISPTSNTMTSVPVQRPPEYVRTLHTSCMPTYTIPKTYALSDHASPFHTHPIHSVPKARSGYNRLLHRCHSALRLSSPSQGLLLKQAEGHDSPWQARSRDPLILQTEFGFRALASARGVFESARI